MIILIGGASHTGKTALSQKLLEKYRFPYLSIDHLKMGLIRSGLIDLKPEDDEQLSPLLWSVAKEIVKTAVENRQNLIVEGCYIPFDWKKDFSDEYLSQIRYYCLIMTERYIETHFSDILAHANAVERRLDETFCTKEAFVRENGDNLRQCRKFGCEYVLIDEEYNPEIDLP